MTAKQYLQKYRKYMSDIVFYETLKESAIKDISSLKSPGFEERVKSSPKNDPVGNLVVELEKNIAKYNMEILNCRSNIAVMTNQINRIKEIDEDYHKLLVYRYIMGLDWDSIAAKMFMGVSTAQHLHSPALATFHNNFHETYN